MSGKDLRIFQGGLMRCCIQTLYEEHDAGRLNTFHGHGTEIKCKWCNNGMVKNDLGIWEWEHAKNTSHYADSSR